MTIDHKEPLHDLITDRHLLEVQGVTLDRSDIHIIGLYSFACILPTILLLYRFLSPPHPSILFFYC